MNLKNFNFCFAVVLCRIHLFLSDLWTVNLFLRTSNGCVVQKVSVNIVFLDGRCGTNKNVSVKWFEILGNYSDFVSTDMFTVTTCWKHTGIVVFSVHSILSVGSHSLSSFVCPASLLCSLSSLLFHLSLFSSSLSPFLFHSFIYPLPSFLLLLPSFLFPSFLFRRSSFLSHRRERKRSRESTDNGPQWNEREKKEKGGDVFPYQG